MSSLEKNLFVPTLHHLPCHLQVDLPLHRLILLQMIHLQTIQQLSIREKLLITQKKNVLFVEELVI